MLLRLIISKRSRKLTEKGSRQHQKLFFYRQLFSEDLRYFSKYLSNVKGYFLTTCMYRYSVVAFDYFSYYIRVYYVLYFTIIINFSSVARYIRVEHNEYLITWVGAFPKLQAKFSSMDHSKNAISLIKWSRCHFHFNYFKSNMALSEADVSLSKVVSRTVL